MGEDADHLPGSISTDRLLLRRHEVADAEAIAQAIAVSDAELRPWMPWVSEEAKDLAFQRQRLLVAAPGWGKRGGEATYMIKLPHTNVVVGICGIQNRRDRATREFAYWIRSDHTGNGYATAAAMALTVEALRVPGVARVEIRCDRANTRSAAVARRCGYRLQRTEPHEPEAPGHTGTFLVWAYDNPP